MSGENTSAWGSRLAAVRRRSRLVAIAREQRLVHIGPHGPVRVGLTTVDEDALALLELAMERGRGITFVYPAPAGEVAVLLAAQLILHRFVRGDPAPSVGLLTADTTGASKTWEGLAITTRGGRTPISEVFPCYRADPEGESPFGNRRLPKGILIGAKCRGWRVDHIVVDHLAGRVEGAPQGCAARVFADPLDPTLDLLADRGELVWGWSPTELRAEARCENGASRATTPFSVAEDRLATIANGVRMTIGLVHNESAEACLQRLRDDLHTLADLYRPEASPASVMRGLRVAWHHVSTLASLPGRPSDFDRFAGVPPFAARATYTFEREIGAWAKTLAGDANEIATIIASDLGDLRALLDDHPPFAPALAASLGATEPTVVVLRSRTAGRAMLQALGSDTSADRSRLLHIRTMRGLHREGTWAKAIVVGAPARWDWHRLDSGLSSDVQVLILGRADTDWSTRTLSALQLARYRWGSREMQAHVWSELTGEDIPVADDASPSLQEVAVVEIGGKAHGTVTDPFEPLETMLWSSPLEVADDDFEEIVAQEQGNGSWVASVPAVQVVTSHGVVILPSQRVVEVRQGDDLTDCRADILQPGMFLFIGRREGRLGLLDAVADRLRKRRPDLLAAHLLITDLQTTVRTLFRASGMTKVQLFERLQGCGFDKTYHTARRYVDEDGPIAPRDLADLRRLVEVLAIGWTDRRVREAFAGVQRFRTFRRAAGRALAQAARGAVDAADLARIDPSTGLSLADLRDAVIEAEVLQVTRCSDPVPLSEIGRLVHIG